jgi:hypothetical protein
MYQVLIVSLNDLDVKMEGKSFQTLISNLKLNCKNLEILSLKRLDGVDEDIILFFLEEIQFGRFPKLKFLDLSNTVELSYISLKVVNFLIVTKKIMIIVTPRSPNTLSYFNSLQNQSKTVKLKFDCINY